MKIIKPSVEILSDALYPEMTEQEMLKFLERCGRTCYKSEGAIGEGSAEKLISNILKRGHESVIEHFNITVKFICDRGVSHEIVRHRLASYSQESTRYCNYSKDTFGKEITVVCPSRYNPSDEEYIEWKKACENAEKSYFKLLEKSTPEDARSVLPNSLKTEVVMTCNLREWRHFLKLRTSSKAHPDIRVLALELLTMFKKKYPIIFQDINA